MWKVKRGRLYRGTEPVAIRRVIVQMVMKRKEIVPTAKMVRQMVRLERALSLRGLSRSLNEKWLRT